jgi:hypothetical protein
MAGQTITTASTLMCPHGGTVTGVPSSPRASAGATVLRAADTFVIAGCPFLLPGGAPSPCVTVQWTVADARVTVGGAPTLSSGSVGLCMSAASVPQGPVQVLATQARVSTR